VAPPTTSCDAYRALAAGLSARARASWETIERRVTTGIPTKGMNLMDVPLMEEIAGGPPGSYAQRPEEVYLACQNNMGACSIDQWIPRNPLKMSARGFGEDAARGASTGAERIVLDEIEIDSPEAVVSHLESLEFPRLRARLAAVESDDEAAVADLIAREAEVQALFGADILKIPYKGFFAFPGLRYTKYGYAYYFMAYALYPEVIEQDFRLQADCAERHNARSARAIVEGGLPPLLRLDHDMADSRSTLVDVRSLDRIWFPHFVRAIAPLLDAGIKLIWHCDGNLMEMVPRLLDAGLDGFQGFQYEDGMDYVAICGMKTRRGETPLIQAGASVTTTLPHGTPDDVRRELRFLVENGPPVGLWLGASSSITPGTDPANVKTLIEGLRHFRERGRAGLT
jgi:hypothetical protein